MTGWEMLSSCTHNFISLALSASGARTKACLNVAKAILGSISRLPVNTVPNILPMYFQPFPEFEVVFLNGVGTLLATNGRNCRKWEPSW